MNTSMVETLKEQVCAANLNLAADGVAVYTFFLGGGDAAESVYHAVVSENVSEMA